MARFAVYPPYSGPWPELEISGEEFIILKKARLVLAEALSIEEKYEILLRNFVSIERSILESALRESLYGNRDHVDFFEARVAFNAAIVNLLTAARICVEQFPRHARRIGGSELRDSVKELFRGEYDSSLQYRFMEALRNFVQHNGLAVHNWVMGGGWTGDPDVGHLESGVAFFASRSELSKGKLKAKVLAELPEKIDIVTATRSYIGSLSRVLKRTRELCSECVIQSRQSLKDINERYARISQKEKIPGLRAASYGDNGLIDEFYLSLDWDEVRVQLTERNTVLVNLEKRIVTSRVRQK